MASARYASASSISTASGPLVNPAASTTGGTAATARSTDPVLSASAAAASTAAVDDGDPSTPTTTGASSAVPDERATRTGTRAWVTSELLLDPSSTRATGLWPWVPTTTRSPGRTTSRTAPVGDPNETTVLTALTPSTSRHRSAAVSSATRAVSVNACIGTASAISTAQTSTTGTPSRRARAAPSTSAVRAGVEPSYATTTRVVLG